MPYHVVVDRKTGEGFKLNDSFYIKGGIITGYDLNNTWISIKTWEFMYKLKDEVI